MTTLVRSLVAAGGFAVLVGVTPAHAQVLEVMTFTTSFPFTVGQKTLPAGSYTVRPAYEGDGSLLQIEGQNQTATFFGENATTPRSNPNEDAVIFDRTGDHYALSEIWDGAEHEGADIVHLKGAETVKISPHHAKK